jgi:hypothetical protein
LLIVSIAAVALALLPMAAAADEGTGDQHFGPFAGASTDSGTCADWAADTFTRDFAVHPNPDGSFRVIQGFSNGKFVTIGGASPGACETNGSSHGSIVTPGVNGQMGGFMDGTVRGATSYNRDGCSVPAACNTTKGFLIAVFGPSALYTCRDGGGACSFFFAYYSPAPSLKYRLWINASSDLGGNRGDIATA